MEEVKADDKIILFIDEVHTLIGAGAAEGAIDAANILKPALARGELQCIGATTIDEYRKHIEKDPALERRFQPVQVPEPSVDECIQILKGLQERYELHHKLKYTPGAIESAAKFAHQYISDRFLPDKAIDLIDEAGSRVRLQHAAVPEAAREMDKELRALLKEKDDAVRNQDFEKAGSLRDRELELKTQIAAISAVKSEEAAAEAEEAGTGPMVTEKDIASIVAMWTGIPVDKVTADESSRLMAMEETLHKRLVGQEEAVVAVSRAIRRARTGLKNPNRPVASFIFSGPTGVGKSELAKSLATYYFGSEEAMVRLDMSEFMERHTVSKLIGSPPGYVGYNEGGQLTEAVRRRPYTLVLFDEIEKAHPDVFNMMLQILEDGRLTDSKGRVISFKNVLLIMTSNVGSSVIEKGGGGLGFQLEENAEDSSYNRIKNLVNEELKNYFRPEARAARNTALSRAAQRLTRAAAHPFSSSTVWTRSSCSGSSTRWRSARLRRSCCATSSSAWPTRTSRWTSPTGSRTGSVRWARSQLVSFLLICSPPHFPSRRGLQPPVRRPPAAPRHHAPAGGQPGGAHAVGRHQGRAERNHGRGRGWKRAPLVFPSSPFPQHHPLRTDSRRAPPRSRC